MLVFISPALPRASLCGAKSRRRGEQKKRRAEEEKGRRRGEEKKRGIEGEESRRRGRSAIFPDISFRGDEG